MDYVGPDALLRLRSGPGRASAARLGLALRKILGRGRPPLRGLFPLLRDEFVSGDDVAQRILGGFGNADPRRHFDPIRPEAVVHNK